MNFIWLIKWNFFIFFFRLQRFPSFCLFSVSLFDVMHVYRPNSITITQERKFFFWYHSCIHVSPSNQDSNVNIKFVCPSVVDDNSISLMVDCSNRTEDVKRERVNGNYLPEKKKKIMIKLSMKSGLCSLYNHSQRDTICLLWLITQNFAFDFKWKHDDCYNECDDSWVVNVTTSSEILIIFIQVNWN